jgi:hypothetical protein
MYIVTDTILSDVRNKRKGTVSFYLSNYYGELGNIFPVRSIAMY